MGGWAGTNFAETEVQYRPTPPSLEPRVCMHNVNGREKHTQDPHTHSKIQGDAAAPKPTVAMPNQPHAPRIKLRWRLISICWFMRIALTRICYFFFNVGTFVKLVKIADSESRPTFH